MIHVHPSWRTTKTSDPKPAAELWMEEAPPFTGRLTGCIFIIWSKDTEEKNLVRPLYQTSSPGGLKQLQSQHPSLCSDVATKTPISWHETAAGYYFQISAMSVLSNITCHIKREDVAFGVDGKRGQISSAGISGSLQQLHPYYLCHIKAWTQPSLWCDQTDQTSALLISRRKTFLLM